MPLPTGNPDADAADAFGRARRQQVLSALAQRLRGEPDVDTILPFDEVVAALGMTGQRDLGLQVVRLDSIVGTVDRTRDFDRRFRPTTGRSRQRFERLGAAARRGEAWPPIDLYRVGEAHFVQDGHHRVAVARSMGIPSLEAHVTEILTGVPTGKTLTVADLPLKSSERLFRERVPLPPDAAARVRLRDPAGYGELAENIEAWGFRAMQTLGELLDRPAVARSWYEEEYVPVVELLHETGLAAPGEPETEAYMRLAAERWRLLQTWSWDDDVIERLRRSRPRSGRR